MIPLKLKLLNSLKLKPNSFLHNLAYVGGAEVVNRFLRLGVTVVLSRLLTPTDYGGAAIALLVTDFAKSFFLSSGFATKLLHVKDDEVDTYTNTCHYLGLILSVGIFFSQIFVGLVIGFTSKDLSLAFPIAFMALCTPLSALGQANGKLLFRENRQPELAKINTGNFAVSCILQIIFAFMGFKLWAVIIPQVFTSFLWGQRLRRAHSWRPSKFSLEGYKEFLRVGSHILGVELLNKTRTNIDYILVTTFFGVEALGFYYFAFNAGLGISQSAIRAVNNVLLPHLAKYREDYPQLKKNFLKTLKNILTILVPLVLLQSLSAPFYVPIIFGAKWVPAVPVLIFICLSALTRPLGESSEALLNATGHTIKNLQWNIMFTIVFTLCLTIAAPYGLNALALTVMFSYWIAMPLFAFRTYVFVFRRINYGT